MKLNVRLRKKSSRYKSIFNVNPKNMALTVIGVFDDAQEAQKAVNDLVSEGFSRDSIDLSTNTGQYADGAYTADRTVDHDDDSGISGFFKSLFGSDDDDDYRRHTTVAQRGSLVTVHAMSEDEAEKAADILDDNGAVNVDDRAEQYGYAGTGTMGAATGVTGMGVVNDLDMTSRDLTDRSATNLTDADQTIKVIKENLEVGKREVEQGGVRVRSRIIERPVEESVRLREERVTVQRNPVNRPATDADLTAFKEGDITMTERSEVPVVSKTANVVEEISVGKEVNERTETIRDTVRETDVDVENLGTTDDMRNRTTTDRDNGIIL